MEDRPLAPTEPEEAESVSDDDQDSSTKKRRTAAGAAALHGSRLDLSLGSPFGGSSGKEKTKVLKEPAETELKGLFDFDSSDHRAEVKDIVADAEPSDEQSSLAVEANQAEAQSSNQLAEVESDNSANSEVYELQESEELVIGRDSLPDREELILPEQDVVTPEANYVEDMKSGWASNDVENDRPQPKDKAPQSPNLPSAASLGLFRDRYNQSTSSQLDIDRKDEDLEATRPQRPTYPVASLTENRTDSKPVADKQQARAGSERLNNFRPLVKTESEARTKSREPESTTLSPQAPEKSLIGVAADALHSRYGQSGTIDHPLKTRERTLNLVNSSPAEIADDSLKTTDARRPHQIKTEISEMAAASLSQKSRAMEVANLGKSQALEYPLKEDRTLASEAEPTRLSFGPNNPPDKAEIKIDLEAQLSSDDWASARVEKTRQLVAAEIENQTKAVKAKDFEARPTISFDQPEAVPSLKEVYRGDTKKPKGSKRQSAQGSIIPANGQSTDTLVAASATKASKQNRGNVTLGTPLYIAPSPLVINTLLIIASLVALVLIVYLLAS